MCVSDKLFGSNTAAIIGDIVHYTKKGGEKKKAVGVKLSDTL
jgi:hypothetical protein